MKKRIFSVFLSALMCVSLLAGCGSATQDATANGNVTESTSVETTQIADADTAKAESVEAQTRTIIDHLGNEVVIPAEINTIVTTSITPMPSVYCMFAGSAERLIGMSPSSKAAAENSLLVEIMPEIKEVSTEFMTGGEVNVEELVAMNPDIVFCNASKEDEYEKLRAAGLAVIAVSTSQWGSDSVETFEGWITL